MNQQSSFQNQRTIIVRLLPAELAESTFEDSPLCTCGYCTKERQSNPKRHHKQLEKWSRISFSNSSLYLPTSVIHWDLIDTTLPSHHPDAMMSSQRNLLLDCQIQAMHDHCFPLDYDDRFYNWCKFGMNHVILLAMQKSGLVGISSICDDDSQPEQQASSSSSSASTSISTKRQTALVTSERDQEEIEQQQTFASRLENLLSGAHVSKQQPQQSSSSSSLMRMFSDPEEEQTQAQLHQNFLFRSFLLQQPTDIDRFIREKKNGNRRFLPPKTGLKMVRGDGYRDEFNGRTKYDNSVNEIITSSLKEYYLLVTRNQNKNDHQENSSEEKKHSSSQQQQQQQQLTKTQKEDQQEEDRLLRSKPCFYSSRISPCLEGYDQIQGIAISRVIPPTKRKPLIASVVVGQQCVTPPLPNREALGALAYIATLGVREDSRGKGLATEMIRRTLEECSGNFSGNVCDAPWMKDKLKAKHNKGEGKDNNDDVNEHQQPQKSSTTTSSNNTIIARCDSCLFRCNRVYLHCLDTNIPALKLYANLGFEATDTLPNYYFLEARWRSAIVLTRPIINRPEPTRHSLTGNSEYDLTGEEEDDEVLRRMAEGEIVGDGPPRLPGEDEQQQGERHWTTEMMRVIALLTPAAVAAAMMF